ncbi:O-antigen polymerase [Vibrio cyclitrophicus]
MITLSILLLALTFFVALLVFSGRNKLVFGAHTLPLYIVLLIYFLFFLVTPTYWHFKGEYVLFGNDLELYIPFAIVCYSVGLISLLVGYNLYPCNDKIRDEKSWLNIEVSRLSKRAIIFMFLSNLLLVMYWAQTSGYTIRALFLLNVMQNSMVYEDIEVTTGPLYLFIESLIVTGVLVVLNDNISKPFKLISGVLIFIIFISLGFRFRMILFIMILLYSHLCIKKFKSKDIRKVFLYLFLFCSILVSMSYLRNYVKQVNRGVEIELQTNERSTLDTLFSSTRNFYSFSSLVKHIDLGRGNYDYGETMFANILYRFIPSSFFSNNIKPRPVGVEESAKSWGSVEGYYAGEAYSNFGDYYQAFGIFGVCVFNLIFGMILACISNKIKKDQTVLSIGKFTLIVLSCSFFQMITRGYLPQYILILMYLLIPIFCLQFLFRKINWSHI